MEGEIPLPIPVINKIEWNNNAPYYCQILNLSEEVARMLVENSRWYVIDPKSSNLTIGQLLTKDELDDARSQFGWDTFIALTGAECLDSLIGNCKFNRLFEKYSSEGKNLSTIWHDEIR